MKKALVLVVVILAAVAVGYALAGTDEPRPVLSFKGEPKTPEQLGEMLFFEKKLSLTKEVSCASCHIPQYGFADTIPFSKGVDGRLGKRNTSSCANMTDRPYFFYDGRAVSLEDQVQFPVEDHNEMGMPLADVVKRLNSDNDYVQYFKSIYKQTPGEENLKSAVAAFERTLETSNTPFDRYMKGDDNAISASAQRGRELFMSDKAKCFDCHFSPDFTGDEFRNIGLYDGVTHKDEGRYAITKDIRDLGKFKVPSMRNVAVTAPYMHNGMFKTLREVIDYYDDPYKTVVRPINMDSLLLKPLHLTEQEKVDLENFLHTLTDDRFAKK